MSHESGCRCLSCRERIKNGLELAMIRLGADFETHGGKRVRFKGYSDDPPYMHVMPIGSLGTVKWTSDKLVYVKWEGRSTSGIPNPTYAHTWESLEVIESGDFSS